MHVKKKHKENVITKNVFKKFKSDQKSEFEGKGPENHIVNKENIMSPESDSNLSNHEVSENDLSFNLEIDGLLGKFKCDLCNEIFSSESNLSTHLELKHDFSFDVEKNPKTTDDLSND